MKILVAYDGSESGDAALIDLQLAGLPTNTTALVLSVLDGWSPEGAADPGLPEPEQRPEAEQAREQQRAIAEHGADQLRRIFPHWTITAEMRIGAPAWEIIKCAEGYGTAEGAGRADLVVLGSSGVGALKRLLLGNVAHHVVTNLRGSVRVARGRPDRLIPQSGVIAPPRLVVGVDGSDDSRAAVEAVASRHWPIGTRVVVATFETGPVAIASQWEPESIWGGTPNLVVPSRAEGRPALRVVSEAAEFLKTRCPGLTVTTLVRPADPKYGLVGAAEDWDEDGADCIFVGASGVRGIARFLLGSVSTSVAMNAGCTVEIVRRGI